MEVNQPATGLIGASMPRPATVRAKTDVEAAPGGPRWGPGGPRWCWENGAMAQKKDGFFWDPSGKLT